MKSERKNKSLIIKGIKKSEYPLLYECTENVMKAFDMDAICVEVKKGSIKGKRIYAGAGWTISLKKLIPTYCDRLRVTHEMLDEMTKDEMEAIIAHEFSHIFNRDAIFDFIIEKLFCVLFLIFALFIIFALSIIFAFPINLIIFFFLFFWLNSSWSEWSEIYKWVFTIHEIRSDIESVARTQKPEGMKSALRKLEYLNMGNQKKPNIFIILRQKAGINPPKNIHPPKKKRLEYVDYMTKVMIRDTENPKRPNVFKILSNTWKEFNTYKKRDSYLLTEKEFECLDDLILYIGLTF